MKNADPGMVVKLNYKPHLLYTFFDFLSGFLRVWLQSSKKVLIWPKKKKFLKNSKKVSKDAKFHADSKSVEKVGKQCTQKKLQAKQIWRTWAKVKKVHISVTFLLITFLVHFFSSFSTNLKSPQNSGTSTSVAFNSVAEPYHIYPDPEHWFYLCLSV